MSLFAEKKIVEVRLPSGKPGVAGAKALETHASNAIDGVMTIVSVPRLERRDRQARWVEALERAGVMVDIDTHRARAVAAMDLAAPCKTESKRRP